MSFGDEEIRRQLRLGEDSRWEFKEIRFAGNSPKEPSRDDFADEIAAFANSEGGVLLCGVTDAGDVVGMSRGQMDELERLLVEVCTDTIKPRFDLSSYAGNWMKDSHFCWLKSLKATLSTIARAGAFTGLEVQNAR